MKGKFLMDEIWLLTIMGAFQRSNAYKDIVPEKQKNAFKNDLRKYINNLIEQQYYNTITEEKHIENIKSLSKFSSNFSSILIDEKINFGISQKLLNLYLKYAWCLNLVSTPPHFPVDRIIQLKLKVPKVYAWTQMKDEKQYLEVINHAKKELVKYDFSTLAELELYLFDRN